MGNTLNKGMSGIHSTKMIKDEWLTPPYILEALGEFDLDPCAPVNKPWDIAKNHFTIYDNGLMKSWSGRVWCNPPYGSETGKWLSKLAHHGNGIALIYARTETKMFFDHIWYKAIALFFLKGRITFYHSDGTPGKNNGGAPSVLIAYGANNRECLEDCGLEGKYISI